MDVANIIQNLYFFEVIGVIGFLACFGIITGHLSSGHIPFGGGKLKKESHAYVSMSCSS